mgnify:CR=1 FL=1
MLGAASGHTFGLGACVRGCGFGMRDLQRAHAPTITLFIGCCSVPLLALQCRKGSGAGMAFVQLQASCDPATQLWVRAARTGCAGKERSIRHDTAAVVSVWHHTHGHIL